MENNKVLRLLITPIPRPPSIGLANEEKPQIRIFRRSASLPSNLNSGEFSIVLESDHSVLDESFVESNVQDEQNAFNCEQCSSMVESLKSNVYMSLLEFQSNCPRRQQPRGALSESQQELLELMYAFKRGEKTLSQVEQQFKEWHSRQMGVIFPSAIDTHKQEKHPKRKGNLGLKKILGIPKKKTSTVDIRSPDIELDILRRGKKASESSSSSPKRLSKMSQTSTTSSASEIIDTVKANKTYGKKSEAGSSGISVGPPFPNRPPPMPPVKQKPTHEPKPQLPLEGTNKNQKPIPPPKPKSLFRQKTCDFDDDDLTDSAIPVGKSTLPENTWADNNEDDIYRRASSIYVEPNSHKTTGAGARKKSDAKTPKLPIKLTEPNKTRNPAIRAPQGSTSKPVKKPPNLPPHTKELLKMANLLKFDEEVMSKFYIRRSKSFPNLRMSQMQNIPIYLQLIDSVVEPKSTQSGQNTNVWRFDNRLYFHEFKDDELYTELFSKSSCK